MTEDRAPRDRAYRGPTDGRAPLDRTPSLGQPGVLSKERVCGAECRCVSPDARARRENEDRLRARDFADVETLAHHWAHLNRCTCRRWRCTQNKCT
eukprot:1193777-Prorocentrum_minimum.AAC.3